MGGEILQAGGLRQQLNFVPLPYRRVSFQPYAGPMTAGAIENHISSREVYRRTDIIISCIMTSRNMRWSRCRENPPKICSISVDKVEVLALPEDCIYLESPETDPANRSALAKLAVDNNVSSDKTVIVSGHV